MKMHRGEIKLPESLYQYLKHASTRQSVDALLEHELQHLADGMQWDELINHCNTLILAHKVRRDYVESLIKASKRVWRPLIRGTEWRELTIGELEQDYKPAPNTVWRDSLYRIFINRETRQRLTTALSFNIGEGLVAYLSLAGASSADIPTGWEIDGEDPAYWRTQPGLADFRNTHHLEVSRLMAAADDAISVLSLRELEAS
ncbi:hypothetical protein ACUN9Y_02050 [Halomonas sp. V046]|uniref:hypothetical protein n=1 Tax=Halomonas sp. V046 TaxID=3459611 RepID=UPI004044D2E3